MEHLPPPDADDRPTRSLPRATTAPVQPTPTPPAAEAATPPQQVTLFEAVGGEGFFHRLVDAFYAHVADDPVLRPLYPEADLAGANERLRLFLIQYWGGPTTYSEQRGHPRLRMRHAPYPVGTAQIEAWLAAMRAAVDEVAPHPAVEAELWAYFERSAQFMRNTDA